MLCAGSLFVVGSDDTPLRFGSSVVLGKILVAGGGPSHTPVECFIPADNRSVSSDQHRVPCECVQLCSWELVGGLLEPARFDCSVVTVGHSEVSSTCFSGGTVSGTMAVER